MTTELITIQRGGKKLIQMTVSACLVQCVEAAKYGLLTNYFAKLRA